jgi:hypothetical protein
VAKFDLKKFRHDISVLKKRGIVPPNVDARSAQPYNIRGGKPLSDYVKKYATESPKKKAPAKPPAKTPSKKQTAPPPAKGIQVIDLKVPYHNMEQYLRDAMKDHKRIDRMKRNREFFSFRFFGHNTDEVYSSIELMLERLLHYESIERAYNKHDAKAMHEQYRNLAVVKVPTAATYFDARDKEKMDRKVHSKSSEYFKKLYQKRKKKLARAPKWKQEQQREANAERQRAYRARLKGLDLKQYNEAGAERKAKSRTTAKAPKKKGKK